MVGEGAGAAVWEDCARGGVDRFTPKLFTNMCPTFRGYPIFWVGVRKMPHHGGGEGRGCGGRSLWSAGMGLGGEGKKGGRTVAG